jgi:dihydroorotate dehydrogenase electron transfer subunit
MRMKRYLMDLQVVENTRLHPDIYLLKLTSGQKLPEMIPGQFVQVRVDDSPKTFLRRPISIHYINKRNNELWLLIQVVGEGTGRLAKYRPGETVNVMLPLGNGFSAPQTNEQTTLLLIGGGIGIAPLLFWGETLKSIGYQPEFLLGSRTRAYIIQLGAFEKIGKVYLTTEDHSIGEKGFVTHHPILQSKKFDKIYACGPLPMMVAVARYAKSSDIDCEVSLENSMACGIGACLCCVENTVQGNVCVCTEGPVFNIKQLTWQI